MATTMKTPGFNCRIAIFFQSDKNGRKCAYYWSGRLGDGRAIRMKLTEAELLVAQGQADLLPCHPLKAATQEPEQVVVEPVIEEEKQAMTAIELYNLSNAFNNMRQSTKKRAIATMLENMACEHGYITIEGKMYHFNGDKLTRNYEESKCYWCNVVKPVLTDETITYTIVSRPASNAIPFIARVLVPGQEVQEYDPQPSCWWMYTEGDLVNAVNKQFKGAWYLKPEVFDTRVAEQQKVEDVASEMDITTSEVAAIAAIAQQAKEDKQADRETFEAESRLETVLSDGQAQERQVVRVEKKSDFSMCGTSWFYAHPECFSIKKILQRDNTDGHRYTTLNHREVGSRATCVECGVSVHEMPVQQQEEVQHMEKQETAMSIETTREEWLASLKEGDRVATHHRLAGYRLYTVDRRTPSGRIILASGEQYDKNGREIGGQRWDTNHLEEVTPKVLADIEHKHLVSAVNVLVGRLNINNLNNMSDNALKEIRLVLKKHSVKDEG